MSSESTSFASRRSSPPSLFHSRFDVAAGKCQHCAPPWRPCSVSMATDAASDAAICLKKKRKKNPWWTRNKAARCTFSSFCHSGGVGRAFPTLQHEGRRRPAHLQLQTAAICPSVYPSVRPSLLATCGPGEIIGPNPNPPRLGPSPLLLC